MQLQAGAIRNLILLRLVMSEARDSPPSLELNRILAKERGRGVRFCLSGGAYANDGIRGRRRGAGILCCDPSVKRRLLGGMKGGTVGL